MDKDLAITQLANLLEGRKFTNIPGDAGHGTTWGITQATYDAYRKAHGLALQSVQLITWPEASWIYDAWFWTPSGCRELPDGLDFTVFQWSVNSGVKEGVKVLQQALGFAAADVDGDCGPMTVAAVRQAPKDDLILGYLKLQHDFYLALEKAKPEDEQFAHGWDNRIRRTANLVGIDLASLTFLLPPAAAASLTRVS